MRITKKVLEFEINQLNSDTDREHPIYPKYYSDGTVQLWVNYEGDMEEFTGEKLYEEVDFSPRLPKRGLYYWVDGYISGYYVGRTTKFLELGDNEF
jgi:hypothetical protein